jgi:hypothetical protein
LDGNPIGETAEHAIAEAVAVNECTALSRLFGVSLCKYVDTLGVPDEFRGRKNEEILTHLREMHLCMKVKSARSSAR